MTFLSPIIGLFRNVRFIGVEPLGVLYAKGHGVAQDYTMAYVWYNIAAAQGQADARKNREAVAAELDAASLAKAQKLSKEYFKRYVEPFQ